MMVGAGLFDGFAAALLDPERPPPGGLVAPGQGDVARRFAVYRNNVTVALVEALKAQFPVTCRLVGEEFFAAMARLFARAEPPRSPVLAAYGADLAPFIAGFPPAAVLPYLGDVARLEWAVARARDAADACALDTAAFQRLPAAALGTARVRLHPAAAVERFRWAAISIWHAHQGDGDPPPVDPDAAEDALVTRPGLEVEVRRLPPGGAAFLLALIAGASFTAAAEAALDEAADFDLAANLACLMQSGAVVAIQP